MEEIKVDDVGKTVAFYAYDSSNHIGPKDGLSSFTVRYFLNNGASTAMTTPTVTEKDSTNMKGWYTLAVDEAGMVSAEGVVSIDISATGMDPVPIKIKIVGNTTKEVYDIINHADYGNAKLARTGADSDTLETLSDQIDNCNTTTPPTAAAIVNEWESQSQADPTGFHVNVKEVNGTAQTANDNSADINAILIDTAVIGALGAGLTAIPWNSAWDTEVESEVTDALIALNLDHLMKTATGGADMTNEVVDNTVLSRILANGDTSVFDPSTDGLQLIRDRGDAAWTTGAGGSDRLLMVDTTIATLASQTSFTLTAGSADDDAYNNCTIVIEDVTTATQKAMGIISDYVGASKTVTLKYDPGIYTMATTDKIYILAENALKATLANRQLNVAADGDIAGNVDGSVASVAGHTAQTGDSYAVVNHADHGNAKLVRSTTPANALDVSATGEAGLDFNNIKNASAGHTLTNITVPTVTALTGKTGFSLLSTGADLILKNSTFALAIADAIWDELITEATHGTATSAGKRMLEVGAYAIHSGTAQAGNNVKITLAAAATAIDGTYNRNLLVLTDGTGKGQTRTIVDYDGTTKIAIIDREWRTNPDATSKYQIVADDTPLVSDQGVAQAGNTSSTIKLRDYASATDDIYLCNVVIIVAGTGRGQARLVGSYNGTTKVVTICGDNWTTTPDTTSVYVMIPYGASCSCCFCDYALGQINGEVDTALNTAIPGSPTADSINERVKAIDDLTQGSGSGDLAAIKTKTDNLPDGIKKNTAFTAFTFLMVDSTDHVTGKTGLTVAGNYTGDGGAVAALTNTGAITEISNGLYEIDITAGELNYNTVTLIFTASGADTRIITIHPST